VQSKALDEAPYKLSGAIAKLAGITFWSLAFSYWFDKPRFLTEGRLATVLIIPSSWGSQLGGHLPAIMCRRPVETRCRQATRRAIRWPLHILTEMLYKEVVVRCWCRNYIYITAQLETPRECYDEHIIKSSLSCETKVYRTSRTKNQTSEGWCLLALRHSGQWRQKTCRRVALHQQQRGTYTQHNQVLCPIS
jgi:hypothetical protein